MYQETTEGITISVTPSFLKDRSSPEERRWVFAYTIEIANGSDRTVQLRSRYWHIMDESGHVEEVRGIGVVGEEPVLAPGDSFTYTSGCPLGTPSGIMRGHFRMECEDGHAFDACVPAFSLDAPAQPRVLN
ncbi:Co2+/Mg2+ efflux protein ApaG [Aureimonas populi]|uniref:Protein ApaG n=1 Tax=Aureimonas populi TaxID=1701758 RepID=A0ABW5CI10_9HYPH|nr:Co2+/Mg2+ efflux protein ApaG [Aureimonas populi]